RIMDDLERILAAGIIGSKHHKVAALPCRFPHQRTLGAVTVTAAAKHGNHASVSACAGGELAGNRGQVAQGIVSVGIIYYDGKRLAAIYAFKASGYLLKLAYCLGDLLQGTTSHRCRCRSSQ